MVQELMETLQQEVERCETLLSSEPDRSKCKWPILTLARLLELQRGISGLPSISIFMELYP